MPSSQYFTFTRQRIPSQSPVVSAHFYNKAFQYSELDKKLVYGSCTLNPSHKKVYKRRFFYGTCNRN